jgi:hypothetical protein
MAPTRRRTSVVRPPDLQWPTEAINRRLQALRRNALGFRNVTHYRWRSPLHSGALHQLLRPRPPRPLPASPRRTPRRRRHPQTVAARLPVEMRMPLPQRPLPRGPGALTRSLHPVNTVRPGPVTAASAPPSPTAPPHRFDIPPAAQHISPRHRRHHRLTTPALTAPAGPHTLSLPDSPAPTRAWPLAARSAHPPQTQLPQRTPASHQHPESAHAQSFPQSQPSGRSHPRSRRDHASPATQACTAGAARRAAAQPARAATVPLDDAVWRSRQQ